ncbi:MAG TPA: CHAT domain-containing protein [Thermoanaerobaculia bacterium]|nr:CHAT domain-containing protein [Thermoanaerobaculia bacterium]
MALGAFSLSTWSCQRDSFRSKGTASTASPSTPGHAALVAALRSRRLIEPRLTGGFRYIPAGEIGFRLSVRERKQVLDIEESSRGERSLYVSGLLDLVLGRIERAVEALTRAAAEDPRNAAILSDLSAAYLVRAETLDQPVDLVAALEAAEAAVERSPASLEALFNRALIRQRLSLSTQAMQAWREYLEREKDPGWAGEAKAALARLQGPNPAETWPEAKGRLQQAAWKGDQETVTALAQRFPQEARTFAEEEVLGSWADHYHQGLVSRAAADLATARSVGRGLVKLSGESMLADTVAAIDRCLGDPRRLHPLIDGLTAYQQGLLLVKNRKFSQAEAPLERARRSLRQASNPFEAWASFLLIRCAYQRSDYADVQRRVEELLRRVDAARHPVVAGRARWVLGTAQMALARPAEALDSYRFALHQFERARETTNQAAVHSLIASAFNELGDGGSAWRHRALALRGLAGHLDPERLRVTLTNVAFAALDAGYPRVALWLQTEAVSIARGQNDSERLANVLLNRASILDRTRLADPESDLTQARRACERIEDASIRQSMLADLLAVEGHWLSRQAPPRSLPVLGEALKLYAASDRRLMLSEVLGSRAAALRALGRMAEAERDLHRAVEILEEERGSVREGEQRASFSDRTGAVFDAMVLLQTERGEAELALQYSERRRARLLLDWLSALPKDVDAEGFRLGTWTHPRPLKEVRREIPPGVAVLVYEILPDRLLLWVVRPGSVDQRQVRIASAPLLERVRELGRTVAGPEGRLRRAAADVHELLVAPVADLLHPGETLVFIPEGPLFSVPFGLLLDAWKGRYLIEDHPFAVTPSLSLFTKLAARPGGSDFSRASVMVLANPAFDPSLVQLPRLPGSEEEGQAIHAVYPRARLAFGDAAGREALLEGLERYRIVHFGGHALANPVKPLLSSLVLTPRAGREDSGVLYARDLIASRPGKAALVVLSACRSGGGAAPPGEGVTGLLWPFFSRGVSMIVASPRDVSDRAAASLFSTFYRCLAAGQAPAEALRAAQLKVLAASRGAANPSFDWATFQLYGTAHGAGPLPRGESR